LPQPAVDLWGFVDEFRSTMPANAPQMALRSFALRPYLAFVRARKKLFSALANFSSQAMHALYWYAHLGRAHGAEAKDKVRAELSKAGIEESLADLTGLNLREAWQQLPEFQAEARLLFPPDSIADLEDRERRGFQKLDLAWKTFTSTPGKRDQDILRHGAEDRDRRLKAVLKSLRGALTTGANALYWDVAAVELSSEDPALFLTVHGDNALEVNQALEAGMLRASKTLQILSERVRELVQLRWPRLILVAAIRGRPLSAEGVIVPTQVAVSADWTPEWWHLIRRPLSSQLLLSAKMKPWELADIGLGMGLLKSSAELLAIVNHLSDLPLDENLDELGVEVLKKHLDRITPWFNRSISATVQEMAGMVDRVADRHKPERPSSDLVNAAAALSAIGVTLAGMDDIGRQAGSAASALAEWRAPAKRVNELAAVTYLAWASEVVAERVRKDFLP
jgi:hypothetical protein